MKWSNSVFVLLMCMIACIQPFELDIASEEPLLVISGVVTNEDGPQKVRITYTRELDNSQERFVAGASVRVKDQMGNVFVYTDDGGGNYSSAPDFCGKVGDSYHLEVTIDDKTYQTAPQLLRISSPMDSIHWKYKQVIDDNELKYGAQFFVDSHGENSGINYFRYQWEGINLILVPYGATHMVRDGEILPIDHKPNPCYGKQSSSSIILASTQGQGSKSVLDVPQAFISEGDSKLRYEYLLTVKQFSISEQTHEFYKTLKKNNESGGSLFDQQQGAVIGNISVVGNSNELVLGYFEVSGVSVLRRKFTRGKDFASVLPLPSFPYNCGPRTECDDENNCTDLFKTTPEGAIELIQAGEASYIYAYEPESFPPAAFVHILGCTDCSKSATTIVPEYWNEL